MTFRIAKFVFIGGCIGTTLRFIVGLLVMAQFGEDTRPVATLTVNIIGCFLLGLVSIIVWTKNWPVKEFLGAGILGSFTTFSAFSEDMVWLFRYDLSLFSIYLAASLLFGLVAVHAGKYIGSRRLGRWR